MRITLLLLTICLVAPLAVGQDDMDMASMMAFIQPDEHHEYLATYVGDWDYHSTMWMEPGAPPIEMDGTTTYSMGLGGRYLFGEHNGSMMGMPFEGRGTTAYDKATGKFLSSWIDNMGTGIMLFEGQVEDEKLVVVTDYSNPMTDTMEQHRMVTWIDEEGAGHMEYFITPRGGEEMLSMRIDYTRAAGSGVSRY